jgi:predicted permease
MLKSGGQSAHGGPSGRWRRALVVGELGLSMVLLIGAGLLIRTFLNLHAIDPGYRWQHVLTFNLSLPFDRYGMGGNLSRFTRELERVLRAVPGVEAAGAINQLPLDTTPNWTSGYRTRLTAPSDDPTFADARLVTPGYFAALQATLVDGRWITEQDDETQPLVLMVDERLAKRAWPGRSAIDQELAVQVATDAGSRARWGRVVGVVRHLRHHQPSEEVREQVYVPFAQAPRNQMGVVVRSPIDARSLMPDLTRRIAQLDPDLAPAQIAYLAELVGRKEAPARFTMVLGGLFAGFSWLLACLGVYGVISYSVAQRTSEFGVRAALGARREDLLRLVLGSGGALTAAGLAIGLLASIGALRWMKSVLFGVSVFDPATLVAATLLLGLTALVASYVPARRAAAVDPAKVLRAE